MKEEKVELEEELEVCELGASKEDKAAAEAVQAELIDEIAQLKAELKESTADNAEMLADLEEAEADCADADAEL